MHWKELDRGEILAVVGGLVLFLSLFLDWFSLGNIHATLGPCKGPDTSCTGWHAIPGYSILFTIAAVAPLILAWIIVRGHALEWPRGELTAIVSLVALIFILFVGVVDKPGQPRGEISVTYGWFIGLIGAFLILLGALTRSSESAAEKQPPGVL